jgi:hypothetical protein
MQRLFHKTAQQQEGQAMLKRVMSLTLVSLLMQAAYVAAGQTQTNNQHADKIRASIAKVGSCPRGKIEVTLLDNTRLKGCVMDWSDDQFSLVSLKTGQLSKINYSQVAAVKRQGQSTGKSLFWLGAAVAPLIFAIAIVATAKN